MKDADVETWVRENLPGETLREWIGASASLPGDLELGGSDTWLEVQSHVLLRGLPEEMRHHVALHVLLLTDRSFVAVNRGGWRSRLQQALAQYPIDDVRCEWWNLEHNGWQNMIFFFANGKWLGAASPTRLTPRSKEHDNGRRVRAFFELLGARAVEIDPRNPPS